MTLPHLQSICGQHGQKRDTGLFGYVCDACAVEPEPEPAPAPESAPEPTVESEQDEFGRLFGPGPAALAMPAPGPGRFHANPHPVEVRAAVKVAPRRGTQQWLILDAIAEAGESGLTHDEIAVVPGVSDRAHRTRRKELQRAGWVVDSGRTRVTETDTGAIVWVLSAEGRRDWKPREDR